MKEYFIKTQKKFIPVTKEVYYAYYSQKWHERYEYNKRLEKELSFDALEASGCPIETKIVLPVDSIEDEVIKGIMIEKLRKCLLELADDEYFLITELFFKQKTVREVAEILHVPKSSLHRHKEKVLKKLFKYMKK